MAEVVISPARMTMPVFTKVSHATRPAGSWANTASSTRSETWSAILSGCPSETDSDVMTCVFDIAPQLLAKKAR